MTFQFGQVNEIDSQVDDWTHYVERLDYYFVANDTTNAKKKRAILLYLSLAEEPHSSSEA